MTIEEVQTQIIKGFLLMEEATDKYQYIIEQGQYLPIISEQHKTENSLLKGCQSRVWLHAELNDEIVIFTADSDTIITKGIIALLVRVFSRHTPIEIAESNLFFIDQIGLRKLFSPTRNNGLLEIVQQMKMLVNNLQATSQLMD
jgi:cysteine desulfuration protein SufE